jgi:DNA-nicking Smr family endonuclease
MDTRLDMHGDAWAEAQANFVEFYNQHAKAGSASGRFPRLDVVHGYGSTGVGGVLRSRFRGFLDRHSPKHLEYVPGESVDGN